MIEAYENIHYYRKLNHMTQKELAAKVGYTSHAMISKIEKGEIDLTRSMIVKFAEVFGITPAELMGSTGTTAYPEQLSAQEQRLIAYYRKASDAEKDMIFKMLGQTRE